MKSLWASGIDTTPKPTWIEQYWWVILVIVGGVALLGIAALVCYKLVKKARAPMVMTLYWCISEETSQVTVNGGEIFCPPAITKQGYSFAGWYRDSALTVPYIPEKAKKPFALYAKWIKN